MFGHRFLLRSVHFQSITRGRYLFLFPVSGPVKSNNFFKVRLSCKIIISQIWKKEKSVGASSSLMHGRQETKDGLDFTPSASISLFIFSVSLKNSNGNAPTRDRITFSQIKAPRSASLMDGGLN